MDTDLVLRAEGGDQEPFADLVYAVAHRFLAVGHRILSDIDLAEDATQQALLSVWQDLPQLRDPARFETTAWSSPMSSASRWPARASPSAACDRCCGAKG